MNRKLICFCILLFISILLVTGCQMKPGLSLLKIEEGAAPEAVRNFVREQSGQNGIDLYSDGVHGDYLFLNSVNVKQGEQAVCFTDIKCKITDGTLNIYFSEKPAEDPSEKINSKLIYKIDSAADYHRIRIFKNGCEISFDVVGA